MSDSTEEKRERILNTAIQLFGKDGYYGTRMSEVAKRSRVSPKTLYKFFSGKKELFISARQYAYQKLVRDTISNVPPDLEGLDSFAIVKSVLKSYSGFIRKNRGLARILAEAAAVFDEDIKKDEEESFLMTVHAMAAIFNNDVKRGKLKLVAEPNQVAWLFLSLAFLIALAVLLDLDRESVGGFDPEYSLDCFFSAMRVSV